MEVTEVLGWLTLLAVPLNIFAAWLMRKKWKQAPWLKVLRERYIVAVISTCVVLFFGLIFVNNDQLIPPLDVDTTKWITRSVMLILAVVPAVGWILLYRSLRTKGERS